MPATQANATNSSDKIKDQNYTLLQAFEWNTPGGGKHWEDLKSKVEKLASMGITAIWVPPPTKAAGQGSVGYDAFDLYDLGEFDQKGGKATKWGTKDQLKDLVDAAKEAGIVTYVDAVLNHKAGAEFAETFKIKEVDQEDRTKFISDEYEIEGWTGFDYKARNGKYSEMKYRSYHFTGVDYDNKTGKNSIFKIQGNGKDWADDADKSKGSFDYLMSSDVDFDHPEAREDVKNWATWITKELGTVGFRFDALRHIGESFIEELMKKARADSDKELFAVGEFFTADVGALVEYLNRFNGVMSLFDTPLHYNFQQAGDGGADYDLRKIWDSSLTQQKPVDSVTFVDNHDTQPGQTVESWVAPQFKPLAYALILLRHEGYPCIFGGDLWGLADEDGKQTDAMSQLEDFIRCRKLFAYGETRDYWDHKNCLGWVRVGDDNHDGCAVVICNGTGEGSKKMEVGKEHAGEKWTDVLGWHQGEIEIGEDGWAEFLCPASSVSIWTKTDAKGREQFKKE